jgi:hypothetical protein
MHIEHTLDHERAAYELDPNELAAVSGGDSPIGYAVGYGLGYLARLIVEWEPYGTTPFGGMA